MEIKNKKAYFDYEILKEIESGIELKGSEVKSIRIGHCSISESYCYIRKNEVYILNMFIKHYKEANILNHEERRDRKLLLHKTEILNLKTEIEQQGLTIIPLKVYFKKNKIKLLLGLAKGKKLYDKRQSLKEKEMKRRLTKY